MKKLIVLATFFLAAMAVNAQDRSRGITISTSHVEYQDRVTINTSHVEYQDKVSSPGGLQNGVTINTTHVEYRIMGTDGREYISVPTPFDIPVGGGVEFVMTSKEGGRTIGAGQVTEIIK